MSENNFNDIAIREQTPTFDQLVSIIEKNFKEYLRQSRAFTDEEIENNWQRYKTLNHLWQDNTTIPQQDLPADFQRVLNKTSSRLFERKSKADKHPDSLTPEEDIIFRIIEQWGNAPCGLPVMVEWLKEYARKQGPVWVNAISYTPKEPGSYWGDVDGIKQELIFKPFGQFITLMGSPLPNEKVKWLDESGAPTAWREESIPMMTEAEVIKLLQYVRETYKRRKDLWTDNFNIARLTDSGILELFKQRERGL